MTDEERQNIIETARKNLDPEKLREEREELARRLASMPAGDPMVSWRAEAEERESAREEAKAEIASASSASWDEVDTRIQAALLQERRLIMEAVANALGTMVGEQHKKDRAVLQEETSRLWAVLDNVRSTIDLLNKMESSRGQVPDVLRRVN
jgi:hypothetical protein